jgi:hypothetical protein
MLDGPGVVRGGSRGFTVLVVGELLALAVGLASEGLGGLLFAMSAAAGAVTAGTVAGRSDPPLPNGAAAGLFAYVLTIPLRLMGGGVAGTELAFSVVAATVLGGLGGRLAAQATGRQAG